MMTAWGNWAGTRGCTGSVSIFYMPLENTARPLFVIKNYYIFSMSLFIISHLLPAMAVKMS
jgi:hypothetical protein